MNDIFLVAPYPDSFHIKYYHGSNILGRNTMSRDIDHTD